MVPCSSNQSIPEERWTLNESGFRKSFPSASTCQPAATRSRIAAFASPLAEVAGAFSGPASAGAAAQAWVDDAQPRVHKAHVYGVAVIIVRVGGNDLPHVVRCTFQTAPTSIDRGLDSNIAKPWVRSP